MNEQLPATGSEPLTLDDLETSQSTAFSPASGPYACAANAYYKAGWRGILPIPLGKKALHLKGYTGRGAQDPSYPDLQAWMEERANSNIALHMPMHLDYEIVGVDVDAYGEKVGRRTLAELEAQLGELPPTWRSTSRDDGTSGIRFFKVPSALRWPTTFGAGIDSVTVVHRYAVVAPSVHPEGRTYRWIDPQGVDQIGAVPRPDDMAMLPDAWVQHFTGGVVDEDRPKARLSTEMALSWLQAHGRGSPCRAVAVATTKGLKAMGARDGEARHDVMLRLTRTLVLAAAEGHRGALAALNDARRGFVAATAGDRGLTVVEGEFDRAVEGAVAEAIARPETGGGDPCVNPLRQLDGIITPEDQKVLTAQHPSDLEKRPIGVADLVALERNAPGSTPPPPDRPEEGPAFGPALGPEFNDEFWEKRPELTHVREFARARRAAPWAVLGCVLARVVAHVEPFVTLPPMIGGDASLNLFVGLVGPSGGGKGAAEAAAKDALVYGSPLDQLVEAGVGSGEGLAHTYLRHVAGKGQENGHLEQHTTRALFRAPEVDTLAALKGRQGSTLLPKLRDAWIGDSLGFAYADVTRRLDLRAHSYRMCFIVGIQPTRAFTLLDDADGGTPQRFLWMPTQDANVPEHPPATPEPIRWRMPSLGAVDARTGRHRMSVCVTARQAVDKAAIDRHKGNVDALDGHALLNRLKTAAALALLDGRADVNDQDWALAGTVMTVSDTTRARVVRSLGERKEAAAIARGRADGIRDSVAAEVRADQVAKRVAKAILRHLTTEWTTHNDLRKGVAYRDRDHFDEALERLQSAGLIESQDVQYRGADGAQYRLAKGATR